ncbi:hypothetical protein EB72_26860 [Mycobacterium sp. SWH-M1]|nr:hypothetical protein EB72_26860 [Mycobacterium sp. SWH-M1]
MTAATNGERRAPARRTVLVVDDCALHREVLASALLSMGIAVIRTAWDLPSLIGTLESTTPQVILVNMATVGVNTLLRAACSLSPDVPLIAVGVSEDDSDTIFACAAARVKAFHTRSESLADLLLLITLVAQGKVAYPPKIAATLMGDNTAVAGRRRRTLDRELTDREIQILKLLELGHSNQEIAERLSIAVHTVKNHVHSLLTKLGVSTRGEAAALSPRIRPNQRSSRGTGPRSSRNWP